MASRPVESYMDTWKWKLCMACDLHICMDMGIFMKAHIDNNADGDVSHVYNSMVLFCIIYNVVLEHLPEASPSGSILN